MEAYDYNPSTAEPDVTHRRGQHPLFNQLTLEKILSNLPLSSLLECRLVCKNWASHPEINRRLGQNVTICLNNYASLENFLHFLTQWDFSLSHSTSLIFTRFDLHFTSQCHPLCDSTAHQNTLNEKEAAASQMGKEKLSQLFEKWRNHSAWLRVKFLKLTLDKTHLDKDGLVSLLLAPSVKDHLETLFIYNLSHRVVFSQGFIPPNEATPIMFPNLKKLIMDEIRIPIPEFMAQFVSVCGNLEEINLQCDKRSDWENQKGIWKEHSPLATSFMKGLYHRCGRGSGSSVDLDIDLKVYFVHNASPSKLKVIRCGILDHTHFHLLTHLEGYLRLSVLEIYCPAKDVSSELLKRFLETQSRSLKVLKLLGNVDKLRRAVGNGAVTQKNISPEFVLEFPQKMESLKELQLSGRDKDTPPPLRQIHYGAQFPQLNALTISGFASNIGDRMDDYFPPLWGPAGEKCCPTLTNLVLPAEIRDPDFPTRVAQLFPNVIQLHVKYPDNAFLSSLFKSFQKLQRLKILLECSLSVEDAIIGSNEDDGIRSLLKLTNLEITVETEHGQVPTALSERVAYKSLRHMTKLRKLFLLSCCWFDGPLPCNFLSQKCQEELTKELESTVIIFNPLAKTTCPGESCAG